MQRTKRIKEKASGWRVRLATKQAKKREGMRMHYYSRNAIMLSGPDANCFRMCFVSFCSHKEKGKGFFRIKSFSFAYFLSLSLLSLSPSLSLSSFLSPTLSASLSLSLSLSVLSYFKISSYLFLYLSNLTPYFPLSLYLTIYRSIYLIFQSISLFLVSSFLYGGFGFIFFFFFHSLSFLNYS